MLSVEARHPFPPQDRNITLDTMPQLSGDTGGSSIGDTAGEGSAMVEAADPGISNSFDTSNGFGNNIPPPFPDTQTCPFCHLIVSDFDALQLHISEHLQKVGKERRIINTRKRITTHICEECGDLQQSLQIYAKHMKIVHKKSLPKCHLCSKIWPNQRELLKHMNQHNPEIILDCEICSVKCENAHELTLHLVGHLEPAQKQCPCCGNVYNSTSTLKKHMKIHSGERAFNCPICQMFFFQEWDVARHVLTKSHLNRKAQLIREGKEALEPTVSNHLMVTARLSLIKTLSKPAKDKAEEIKKKALLQPRIARLNEAADSNDVEWNTFSKKLKNKTKVKKKKGRRKSLEGPSFFTNLPKDRKSKDRQQRKKKVLNYADFEKESDNEEEVAREETDDGPVGGIIVKRLLHQRPVITAQRDAPPVIEMDVDESPAGIISSNGAPTIIAKVSQNQPQQSLLKNPKIATAAMGAPYLPTSKGQIKPNFNTSIINPSNNIRVRPAVLGYKLDNVSNTTPNNRFRIIKGVPVVQPSVDPLTAAHRQNMAAVCATDFNPTSPKYPVRTPLNNSQPGLYQEMPFVMKQIQSMGNGQQNRFVSQHSVFNIRPTNTTRHILVRPQNAQPQASYRILKTETLTSASGLIPLNPIQSVTAQTSTALSSPPNTITIQPAIISPKQAITIQPAGSTLVSSKPITIQPSGVTQNLVIVNKHSSNVSRPAAYPAVGQSNTPSSMTKTIGGITNIKTEPSVAQQDKKQPGTDTLIRRANNSCIVKSLDQQEIHITIDSDSEDDEPSSPKQEEKTKQATPPIRAAPQVKIKIEPGMNLENQFQSVMENALEIAGDAHLVNEELEEDRKRKSPDRSQTGVSRPKKAKTIDSETIEIISDDEDSTPSNIQTTADSYSQLMKATTVSQTNNNTDNGLPKIVEASSIVLIDSDSDDDVTPSVRVAVKDEPSQLSYTNSSKSNTAKKSTARKSTTAKNTHGAKTKNTFVNGKTLNKKTTSNPTGNGNDRESDTESSLYLCMECNKAFATQALLDSHIELHDEEEDQGQSSVTIEFPNSGSVTYMCVTCCEMFNDKKTLDKHTKICSSSP